MLKIVQNLLKVPKNCTKKDKNLLKMAWKKLAQLWKVSTGGASAASTFFHLWCWHKRRGVTNHELNVEWISWQIFTFNTRWLSTASTAWLTSDCPSDHRPLTRPRTKALQNNDKARMWWIGCSHLTKESTTQEAWRPQPSVVTPPAPTFEKQPRIPLSETTGAWGTSNCGAIVLQFVGSLPCHIADWLAVTSHDLGPIMSAIWIYISRRNED